MSDGSPVLNCLSAAAYFPISYFHQSECIVALLVCLMLVLLLPSQWNANMLKAVPAVKSQSLMLWQKPQSRIVYRQWLLLGTHRYLTRLPWHLCANRWGFPFNGKAANPEVTWSGLLLWMKHKTKEEHTLIIQQAHHGSFMLSTVLVSLKHREPSHAVWEFAYLLKAVCKIKEQPSCLRDRSGTQIMWFHLVLA